MAVENSHGSCSSSVCAGRRAAGAGAGMSTATVIMNVCDDVSRRGGRGNNDGRAGHPPYRVDQLSTRLSCSGVGRISAEQAQTHRGTEGGVKVFTGM